MIVGVGTDIVQMERISHVFNKYGNEFIKKNFHKLEIEKFHLLDKKHHISYLSKRFAAKEAVSKAFGSGISSGLNFKDIAIINDDKGAPSVFIDSAKLSEFPKYNIHISMSDDYPIAVAFVVISK